MKKIILYLLFSSFLYSQNNGNVQNELGIKNTQIFYFDHQFIDPIENGKDFFKPYLSFLKENGTYENTLMDSFVLYDSYFINMFHNLFPKPYNGMYDQDDLNNYLDNIFRKTKLPIIKNMLGNNVGYIGNNENSVLIYPFDIEGNQELELKFNIVAPKLSIPTG